MLNDVDHAVQAGGPRIPVEPGTKLQISRNTAHIPSSAAWMVCLGGVGLARRERRESVLARISDRLHNRIMCGIAGFLNWPGLSGQAAGAMGARMADTLTYRGPDDAGVWSDPSGITLAFRRLAIVDLSPAGRQPMRSADGRWTIVFNGEIYNHKRLRAELDGGVSFVGHSDTEVLLEWIARRGLEDALDHAEGMFAFALWDSHEQRLLLVRDRIGIKPLYWMRQGTGLAFASELKALRQLPGARFEYDKAGVSHFIKYGLIPAPATVFTTVRKLKPGTIVVFESGAPPSEIRYWNASDYVWAGAEHDEGEMLAALEGHVRRAVGQELVADVPVGCFLSGGIDSSLVAATMQGLSSKPIQTFSVGFDDPAIDESAHALGVAKHIGSEHNFIRLDAATAADIIPTLPDMFDEPLADPAAIPTYALSKLARSKVTVALSGDGGDELFAGYDRYGLAERVWRKLAWAPDGARKLAGHALRAAPSDVIAAVATLAARPDAQGDVRRARKLSAALMDATPIATYDATLARWPDLNEIMREPDFSLPLPWRRAQARELPLPLAFQLLDLEAYLPDNVLTKVDRASMAASLEARVPLLDHRFVEFALGLPPEARVRDGQTKWLMRQALYKLVPQDLVERPKRGFSVPIAEWLRKPLRRWAVDLLAPSSIAAGGVLNAELVTRCWREHSDRRADWSYPLWNILMFEAWRQRWKA
jgi:asparagine synthase (glutamine-hydrolysing)